jgi:uncharacterized protein YceK
MKKIVLLLLGVVTLSCSSVEERIKDHSYTNEWYQVNTEMYQVYKTRAGKKYITVLNDKQTNLKRKYIN